jgi:hypothetical protein
MYTYKCYCNSLICLCTHEIDKWILSCTHINVYYNSLYMCTWQYPLVYIMCTYTGQAIAINIYMCKWQYPLVNIMCTYTDQAIVITLFDLFMYTRNRQVDIVMYTYKCYYNSLTCICTHDINKWILSCTHINVYYNSLTCINTHDINKYTGQAIVITFICVHDNIHLSISCVHKQIKLFVMYTYKCLLQ